MDKQGRMIYNRHDLREYLSADSKNYQTLLGGWQTLKTILLSDTISDQRYIWKYIVALRHVEWCVNAKGLWRHQVMRIYWLYRLRKLGYKTGFQIPPNTCGKGLTIWHWGPIIINPATRIGENCTLYPGVLIGHKSAKDGKSATIGNKVFIGAGTKIIGDVHIGDNVTIGQNCVITKEITTGSVVVLENSQLRNLNKANTNCK